MPPSRIFPCINWGAIKDGDNPLSRSEKRSPRQDGRVLRPSSQGDKVQSCPTMTRPTYLPSQRLRPGAACLQDLPAHLKLIRRFARTYPKRLPPPRVRGAYRLSSLSPPRLNVCVVDPIQTRNYKRWTDYKRYAMSTPRLHAVALPPGSQIYDP